MEAQACMYLIQAPCFLKSKDDCSGENRILNFLCHLSKILPQDREFFLKKFLKANERQGKEVPYRCKMPFLLNTLRLLSLSIFFLLSNLEIKSTIIQLMVASVLFFHHFP